VLNRRVMTNSMVWVSFFVSFFVRILFVILCTFGCHDQTIVSSTQGTSTSANTKYLDIKSSYYQYIDCLERL